LINKCFPFVVGSTDHSDKTVQLVVPVTTPRSIHVECITYRAQINSGPHKKCFCWYYATGTKELNSCRSLTASSARLVIAGNRPIVASQEFVSFIGQFPDHLSFKVVGKEACVASTATTAIVVLNRVVQKVVCILLVSARVITR
jgi:hypothetical protein